MVITNLGVVVPCCYDKNAEYEIDNISQKNIKQIWKSKHFMDFRKNVLKDKKQFEICRNCVET
jgi:radical SAM protein with 4Fe4S-binding SPASM domain